MEQADVRPDQILDRVEHLGRMHDLVDPGKQQMRLEIVAARHLAALGAFEVFQPLAPSARPLGRKPIDGADIAVALVAGDLFGCQFPGHQCAVQPPSTNSSVPVTKDESSLARNSAAFATSSGWPMRPMGWRCFHQAFIASGSA